MTGRERTIPAHSSRGPSIFWMGGRRENIFAYRDRLYESRMPSPEASRRNLKKIRHLSNGQPRRSISESLYNNSLILQGALQSSPKPTQLERDAQLGVNQSHISRYSRRLF